MPLKDPVGYAARTHAVIVIFLCGLYFLNAPSLLATFLPAEDRFATPWIHTGWNYLREFPSVALLRAYAAAAAVFAAIPALSPKRFRKFYLPLFLLSHLILGAIIHFNPDLEDVSFGYLGWSAVLLAGSGLTLKPKQERLASLLIWICFGLNYSISGITKWSTAPSWVSGNALQYIFLDDILTRDWIRDLTQTALASSLFHTPWIIGLKLATWGSLALEIFALPLLVWAKTRTAAWGLMLFMQLNILATVGLASLTLPVLSTHVVVFLLAERSKYNPARE